MQELILHIGPWKTGTTAIQHALVTGAITSPTDDCGFRRDQDLEGHYRVAEFALRQDNRGRPTDDWFAPEGASIDRAILPVLSSQPRQIISAESLFRLGPRGLDCLLDWAQPERVHVITAVRDPMAWLWSAWQQSCKVPYWTEWAVFVDRQLKRRALFPAHFTNLWRSCEVPVRVSVLDLDEPRHGDIVRDFADAIGFEVNASQLNTERLNVARTQVETVLTAGLVQQVAKAADSLFSPASIPRYFLGRCCLDIADRSRPMFEMAARAKAGEYDYLFREVGPQETEFATEWRDDCLLASDWSIFDEPSRATLRAHGQRVTSAAEASRQLRRFPIDHLGQRLPLTTETLAMARVLAAAIGSHWRSLQNRPNSALQMAAEAAQLSPLLLDAE